MHRPEAVHFDEGQGACDFSYFDSERAGTGKVGIVDRHQNVCRKSGIQEQDIHRPQQVEDVVNHWAVRLNRGALAAVVYYVVGPVDLAAVGHGKVLVRQERHPGEVHAGHKIGHAEVPVQAAEVSFEEDVLHEENTGPVVAVVVLDIADFYRHSHLDHSEIRHHMVPDRAGSNPVDLDHREVVHIGQEEEAGRCWAPDIVCMAQDVPYQMCYPNERDVSPLKTVEGKKRRAGSEGRRALFYVHFSAINSRFLRSLLFVL